MKFDKDISLNFFVYAANKAAHFPQSSEESTLLMMSTMLGEAIHTYRQENATEFRVRLVAIAALAAIAEQWVMPAGDCECEDCTAKAVAAERASQENNFSQSVASALTKNQGAINAASQPSTLNLALRDFYWVAPIEDNGGMIVTQNPEAYKTILLTAWNYIRARDYSHACVVAAEARNKAQNV